MKVMCLKANDCNKKLFRPDESDVSYVKFEQIRAIVPSPKLNKKGDRIFYEFSMPLDIFEK